MTPKTIYGPHRATASKGPPRSGLGKTVLVGPPNSGKYLELADIALGLK